MADSRIPPPRDVSTPTQSSALHAAAPPALSPAASVSSAASGLSMTSAPPLPSPGGGEGGGNAAYAALAQRVAITEQTLAALQAQVAQLAATVKSVFTNSISPQPQHPMGAGRLFSPFDSPAIPSPNPQRSHEDDTTIIALTQQIAALSTSVAQLQRLQAHGGGGPPLSVVPPSPAVQNGHGNNNVHRHMALPHDQFGGPLSPLSPGRDGYSGGQRPQPNRQYPQQPQQQSFLGDGMDMWNAAGNGKISGSSALSSSAGGREWPTSPNNLGHISGAAVTGPAAPGAGIVVTKWEHLNLKAELLRSISKYGIGPPNKIQARVLPFMLKGSDIIAQAPPTQERIISYVIPALQLCLTLPPLQGPYRGPSVIIITTTVDQATQCHKLVRNVGGPLGVRSALGAGAAGSTSLPSELQQMQREAVQILIGTPAKINEIMSIRGGLPGGECRLLILDEVDQLIARNLYDNVLSVARLLPSPRRAGGSITPGAPNPFSPAGASPYDQGQQSPFNPQSKTPFPPSSQPSRFNTPASNGGPTSPTPAVERQTCIFSNTIPTDVINFSQQLQVRDPVRVLVRREGSTNSQESVSSITPGINVKHTYVYLTIMGSARSEDQSTDGPGTIGSGRASNGTMSEEATRAKEYKLDTLVKMLDDYPLWQAVIHVGSYSMLEAVLLKLSNRKMETLYLSPDVTPPQKKAILQQWRMSVAGQGPRFLICFDVNPKPPDIPWSPLVINFDLPRSVEGYALRAAAAVPPPQRQPGAPHYNGVIVSFVQAAGGDVEMLRSTECAYRFKSAEIPSVFHDLFQH